MIYSLNCEKVKYRLYYYAKYSGWNMTGKISIKQDLSFKEGELLIPDLVAAKNNIHDFIQTHLENISKKFLEELDPKALNNDLHKKQYYDNEEKNFFRFVLHNKDTHKQIYHALGRFSTVCFLEAITDCVDIARLTPKFERDYWIDLKKYYKPKDEKKPLFWPFWRMIKEFVERSFLVQTIPPILPVLNALNRFSKYIKFLERDDISKRLLHTIEMSEDSDRMQDYKKIIEDGKTKVEPLIKHIIVHMYDTIDEDEESIHPVILYKFILLLQRWGKSISQYKRNQIESSSVEIYAEALSNNDLELEEKTTIKMVNQKYSQIMGDLHKKNKIKEKNQVSESSPKSDLDLLKEYFHKKIYLLAKYELYRQLSLHGSNSKSSYDVKRLIYALLTVCVDDEYSDEIIVEKTLETILENQKEGNNIWDTGQWISVGKEKHLPISASESLADLLETNSKIIKRHLANEYFDRIKNLYEWLIRELRFEENEILGWKHDATRERETESYITAFSLMCLKGITEIIDFKIDLDLQQKYYHNYKSTDTYMSVFHDNLGVKGKLAALSIKRTGFKKFNSGILFGLPGTGKSSFAKGLAKELDYDFIEFTPGDFFHKGREGAMERINTIFSDITAIKKTVVFFDEVDDLVRTRDAVRTKDAVSKVDFFDIRSVYTTTLLPKIQELHNNKNIVFLIATNYFENVDQAIRREKRFDLIVPFYYPSIIGRVSKLIRYLRNPYSEEVIRTIIKYSLDTCYNDTADDNTDIIDFLKYTRFRSSAEIEKALDSCLVDYDENKKEYPTIEKINEFLRNKLSDGDYLDDNIEFLYRIFCSEDKCYKLRPSILRGDLIEFKFYESEEPKIKEEGVDENEEDCDINKADKILEITNKMVVLDESQNCVRNLLKLLIDIFLRLFFYEENKKTDKILQEQLRKFRTLCVIDGELLDKEQKERELIKEESDSEVHMLESDILTFMGEFYNIDTENQIFDYYALLTPFYFDLLKLRESRKKKLRKPKDLELDNQINSCINTLEDYIEKRSFHDGKY